MPRSTADLAKLAGAAALGIIAVKYVWSQMMEEAPKPKVGIGAAEQKANAKVVEGGADDEEGVWIYFGSQSGTAQGFSDELAEEAKAHGLTANIVDMEDFDEDQFQRHKCVIVVVATYGEGDPTDNSIEFFKWIQDKGMGDDTLADMSFTVMGLGNRQYVNFNSCGKVADQEMERLGAKRVYGRGEGDDDQNIEEDFEQWKGNGLWPALQDVFGVAAALEAESPALECAADVLAKLQLKAVVGDQKDLPMDPMVHVGGADIFGKWYYGASLAPISDERELLQQPDPAAGKTTKHLNFNVKSFPALEWKTAHNLEILAPSADEDVAWFAERLGVTEELDKNVTFVRTEGVDKTVKRPFPAPCTVRSALTLFCDLVAAPGKMPAKRFAALATDEQDREAFQRMIEDRESFSWLTGDGKRLTLREFFELFMPSAEIDFSTFVQLCPRQKNRPYTIASSSRVDPQTIGVCVSVIQEDLCSLPDLLEDLGKRGHALPRAAEVLARNGESKRLFKGLCSNALCNRAAKGDKLWIQTRPSAFNLPRRSSTPIIMIGAGTGMAPFRAFVQEFKAEGGVRPKTMLFFGCRRRDEDFLYEDELNEALEGKYLTELITAFSREQKEKVYVQDRLRERGAEVAKLLKEGAYLFVCGSTAMGQSVREELAAALGSQDHVDRLQREGHIVEELW